MTPDATSSPGSLFAFRGFRFATDADRVGVFASALCAIHCAVTPFLLLALPAFGKVWAHPASHWAMALVVVPIAALMVSKGYQRHRRTWILVLGSLGIVLVLAGAIAPYVEGSTNAAATPASVEGTPAAANGSEASTCTDSCCPTLEVQEDGTSRLHIPTASVLTTAGGLFLIATHVGNLCRCRSCANGK